MDELAGLSEEARTLALQRFRFLQPHLEANRSLQSLAKAAGITGGNFRLLSRLLSQVERILEINELREVNKAVVDAARESLVIGQS